MDQGLIIQALKSSCGNKNFRFQVIVQDSQLHIYINRKTEQQPDYSFLTDIITQAIACLALDSIDSLWLYSRQLGEIEPDWKTSVELTPDMNPDEIDTIGNSEKIEGLLEQISIGEPGVFCNTEKIHKKPLEEEEIDSFATKILDNTDDSGDFPYFEDFPEDNSNGDSGLLHKTGMVHKNILEEEEINTFATKFSQTEDVEVNDEISDNNNLAQYCFVTNQKLLTRDIPPPNKETMRLVKVFHHLSDNYKHKISPVLDDYFKLAKIANTEKLSVGVQQWFKQITELNDDDTHQVSIWLSRYCFDSAATLEEFKAVSEKQAAIATAKKAQGRNEYNFTPAKTNAAETLSKDQSLDNSFTTKFQLPSKVKKIILPVAWTTATVVLILLGIYTSHFSAASTSQQIPSICKEGIGSSDYCRLGVNLVGEKMIKQSSKNLFPLTKITETAANYGCQRYANHKAGISGNIEPQQTPVISSYGEKIFPHLYVVQAQQKNSKQPGNIRVGCLYTSGQGERSPELLAAHVIPQNWPTEYYQQQAVSRSNLSFGIYTNLVNLGLYTLFAAIGIAIASAYSLGIKVHHSQTIYLVALILGIVQLIAVNLPGFSLFASITLPILTILGISLLVKDFQITWEYGYSLVSVGVLSIIAIQFLLYGLCLGLINSLTQLI